MDQEACRAALAHEPAVERAERLDACHGETFACELFSHPDSPGPVSDDETLGFLLFDPQQVDELGGVKPTALMQIDKAGLSMLRDSAPDHEFVQTVTEMRLRDPNRIFHGVAMLSAAAVRYHDERRLVGLYDTPLEGKRHHVDMIGPKVEAPSKGQKKVLEKRRYSILIEKIGEIVLAADFRQGALLTV